MTALGSETPWADGTRHLLFEPVEFLEKLAALIPRPRVHLVLDHGLLAPHARWRARVVASGDSEPHARRAPSPPEVSETARPGATPRYKV